MRTLACALVVLFVSASAAAQPVAAPAFEYRLTFPAPEHRWMQVEVRFTGLPSAPAQLRMSRSSPGRYALHEFAKNVFEVTFVDGRGRTLDATRPSLHEWDVAGHDGTVVVTYKVFGDRTDGTYLSVDSSHAHINMPAALMFARGLLDRPARVTFVQPADRVWRVASQLFPTADPLVFTAPNIHYLMDSPSEFSDFVLRTFTVDDGAKREGPPPTFRIALHHDGSDQEADAFARDVERVVREAYPIFGELPQFDGNTYTFLSDYLPWASGDGMEHRNSTVLSNQGALRNPAQRQDVLGTASHEFFHAWNMERIRARAIEPFDFEDANVSSELWLGEGFTNYFDGLILHRAGLQSQETLLSDFAGIVNAVTLSPGRKIRSAVEMSQLAPFVDAAASIDRTAWPNVFISYYTYGSAIGLALDLSLRDINDGAVTGDTFMQSLWTRFGKPGQQVPGMVATPYTIDLLKEQLATVSGSRAFAGEFFSRYIEGREVADYTKLFARAGFVLRKRAAGKAWLGDAQLQPSGGAVRVAGLVPFDSPLYKAGVEMDDQIVSLGGETLGAQTTMDAVIGRHAPGESLAIRFMRRTGAQVAGSVVLEEDPRIEVVTLESTGGTLSAEQKSFRERWLASRQPR